MLLNSSSKFIQTIEDKGKLAFLLNNFQYDPDEHWSPKLFIENAIGDTKQDIRHKLELVEKYDATKPRKTSQKGADNKQPIENFSVNVTETRKIKGVFYERLELNDFPMDLQELSIRISSTWSVNEVTLSENTKRLCTVEKEGLLVQQEWDQFDYVKTTQEEFVDTIKGNKTRPIFMATSFILRKPGYFLYK